MTGKGMLLAAVAVACALLGGCAETNPGTQRSMGAVDMGLTYTHAKEVLGMYNFAIASENRDSGLIVSRPKNVDAPGERLLGNSPMREAARVNIIRAGNDVAVQVSVARQRQTTSVVRAVASTDSYDSVPNQSPVDIDAATTPQQNETWQPAGYDYELERKILDDLYTALHPEMRK